MSTRKEFVVSSLDDFLLLGNTFSSCLHNVKGNFSITDQVGIYNQCAKSMATPESCCKFLGFELNAKRKTVGVRRDEHVLETT